MNYFPALPRTKNGDPVPVMNSDGRKTVEINTGATINTVVVQSAPIIPTTRVMPSIDLLGTKTNPADTKFTFTSLYEGKKGEDISITVAAAGTAGIAISENDITITPASAGTKVSALAALIAAHPVISKMISVTSADEDAKIDASQGKAYLNGWSDPLVPLYVRIYATADAFYGKGKSAAAAAPTAEIPITAKVETWDTIEPGEKFCAKSSTASAKVYFTPCRRY